MGTVISAIYLYDWAITLSIKKELTGFLPLMRTFLWLLEKVTLIRNWVQCANLTSSVILTLQ